MTIAPEIDRLIGRCLMVGIRGASPDDPILRADLEACREAHIRSVILFDVHLPGRGPRNIESPAQLRELIAHIKRTLGEGTIVAIDQEGGRVARLKPERGFRASTSAAELGAISATDRRAECDGEAAQLADLGIDLNFAPCVDLGDHPDNPIITRLGRAFGADPGHIASCAVDVIGAHRAHGVIPCMKHFPGHGSTTVDSHLDLPDITLTWNPFRDINPYRVMIAAHPEAPVAIMTGHLMHRYLDPEMPASLSRTITHDMLRAEFGFMGVIITDSLDMGAITKRWPPEESVVLALRAGADIALYGFNAPDIGPDAPHPALMLTGAVHAAINAGTLTLAALRASAARIDAMLRH
jgi:beta-N-acetylhexosaminidase